MPKPEAITFTRVSCAAWGWSAESIASRCSCAAHVRARQIPAFRTTTHSGHRLPIAPNQLARRFAPEQIGAPDCVWGADVNYLPTRDGWLYLAAALALGIRRVVGWAVRTRLEQDLALAAFHMALAHRAQAQRCTTRDRGQYACAAYQRVLTAAGCPPSMSRVSDCWDNAVCESFVATLTKELLADTCACHARQSGARCLSSSRSGLIGSGDTPRSAFAPLASTRHP